MDKAIIRRLGSLLLVLLLALGLSTAAFAAQADADSLRLKAPEESGNVPFSVNNMFPGDAETKEFTVKVDHKEPITLYYHADIRPGSEKLAEVMMVKIELPEKGLSLYDGLMRDMPSALEHSLSADEKEIVYRITAYLDTGVGNDYQYQKLLADFRWWYEKAEEPAVPKPATLKLAAEVLLDGRYPRGSGFTFVLKDSSGKEIQVVNNRDGMIEFDSLSFDKEGTYTYTITQRAGSDGNIQYDDAVYTVTVTVTKGEEAYLLSVHYEKDGEAYQVLPRFMNKTRGSGTNIPEEPDNPKTGDDSNLLLYLCLCLGSALAIVLVLLFGRRRKEDAA